MANLTGLLMKEAKKIFAEQNKELKDDDTGKQYASKSI
jgi:hypothetical protein